METSCLLPLNARLKLVVFGQLFVVVHSVVPRLIRSEQKDLLKVHSPLRNLLIRPHEVKFQTEWSGDDVPVFNPSCIVDTTGPRKGKGLCITRYGGRCFWPEAKRKPFYNLNGHNFFYYGLANYSLGDSGHQAVFQNLSAPEILNCGNDGHPRWFYFQKELYVISWSEGCGPQQKKLVAHNESWERNMFKNWIWKFGTNTTVFLSWDGSIDKREVHAKNFLPFQNDAKLMAIVAATPQHKVYEIDVSTGNMNPVSETLAKLSYDDVGLSAGPVVLDAKRLLVAAHIRNEPGTYNGRRMFFYTCEAFPPFRILEESPLFFFTGDAPHRTSLLIHFAKNLTEKPEHPPQQVEYGVQMQILDNELMLSMGMNDCDAAVVTVPLSSVTSQLRTIRTGPTTVLLSSSAVAS